MKLELLCFIILSIVLPSCNGQSVQEDISNSDNQVDCSDKMCQGIYKGAEFINGSDIAHQFSNTMSKYVGDKLKALYDEKLYSKVDMDNIIMTTKGMGSGYVEYELIIPFIPVALKCEAFTSFDHVGGWNHAPELENRKKQLSSALLRNQVLDISELKSTPEGLQEYWIQWKNKEKQKDCENKTN